MVRVAVAGGTGSIGSAIVEAIAASKKHDVFVLARQESSKLSGIAGVDLLVVDYSDSAALAEVLQKNSIDTIISCITMNTEEASESQLNLIRAADLASTVKRFAPSEFGIDYMEASRQKYPFHGTESKVAAIELLKTTSLSYCRFISGTFMDYFGPPSAPSRLVIIALVVDHVNRKAVICGDGETPVILTHSTDVGKFITAALDLDKWDEHSWIIGDRITQNEIVRHAESAAGVKFEVVHQSIEDFQAAQISELPINIPKYQFLPEQMVKGVRQGAGLAMAQGWADRKTDGITLNERLPEVKSMSVAEFFNRYSTAS